jgi:hypothetical protein
MKKSHIKVVLAVFFVVLAGRSQAECTPTVTFDNRSGSDASVNLVGPAVFSVAVPDGSVRSVSVSGGVYYTLTRYGVPGHYSYSRGDSFPVRQLSTPGGSSCSRITITLHKVQNGNYASRPSSAAEFEGSH